MQIFCVFYVSSFFVIFHLFYDVQYFFFDWKWFPHNKSLKLCADFLDKISQRFQVFFWKQMKFDNEKVEMSEQGVEVCLCVQVVHLLNFVKVMNVHMDKHSIHPVHSDPKLRIQFKNSWEIRTYNLCKSVKLVNCE